MNYRYTGPVSGLHLPDGGGELVLITGNDYTLPDSGDVQRLQALGFLTPQPAPEKPQKGKTDV